MSLIPRLLSSLSLGASLWLFFPLLLGVYLLPLLLVLTSRVAAAVGKHSEVSGVTPGPRQVFVSPTSELRCRLTVLLWLCFLLFWQLFRYERHFVTSIKFLSRQLQLSFSLFKIT